MSFLFYFIWLSNVLTYLRKSKDKFQSFSSNQVSLIWMDLMVLLWHFVLLDPVSHKLSNFQNHWYAMWPKFRVFLGLREEPTFSYLFYLELIETPMLNLFNPKLKWKKNVYYMHFRYNLNFPLIIYSRCKWYGVCSFHTLEIELHFFLEHANDMLWAKSILSVWWAVCTGPEYIFIVAS